MEKTEGLCFIDTRIPSGCAKVLLELYVAESESLGSFDIEECEGHFSPMPWRVRDLMNNLNRYYASRRNRRNRWLKGCRWFIYNIEKYKKHENPFIQVEGCASDAMAICFSSYTSIRIKTYTHTLNPLEDFNLNKRKTEKIYSLKIRDYRWEIIDYRWGLRAEVWTNR